MELTALPNRLGEPLLTGQCASGLTLVVNPRPRFASTHAALGAHFGSIDRLASSDGSVVPMGLAHFLEHKLFEDEQGDVSDRFAAMGATTNAMTSFCGTTFTASSCEDPLPMIELLLTFVQQPWFTDELVAAEQGIIAQEIRMYDDDPDWRVFFALLESLYARHPVRDNIAGTVESIAEIDAATLRRCYERFYPPANLCLAVAGGVDVEALAALVEADQAARDGGGRARHRRAPCPEPLGVLRRRVDLELPVQRPRLLLGIKETELGGSGEAIARRQLATRVALDILFGRSSPCFQELYGEGLVDESFGASHSAEEDFGFSTIGGDSDKPEALAERLLAVLSQACERGLEARAFARTKAKLQGLMLRALDAPEAVAHGCLSACFRGVSPFVALELVDSLERDELQRRLAAHVHEEATAMAIARPAAR